MRIAIIGSQEPTEAQRNAIKRAVGWIKEQHPQASVVGFCHRGVGELALRAARAASLHTIGVAPLEAYSDIQKVAHEVESLYDTDPKTEAEAEESVSVYAPAPDALSRDGFCFHASMYLAVRGASLVIALPGEDEETGTKQGIRIALAMKKTTWCLGADGKKVDPAEFAEVRAVPAKQTLLTFICDACDWSVETQFGEDPRLDDACPECGNIVRIFDEEGNQIA